jgi:hypothetical protein
MTIKYAGLTGIERTQALGLPTRYATTRTSEAKVTLLPDGRYKLSVSVPLAEIKPFNLNQRVRTALLHSFVPTLSMTASKKQLETSEPVQVTMRDRELRIEATFSGDPSELTALLKENKGIDLQFRHKQGLSEFRVDLQLSELEVDRTPAERGLAEKAVSEAKTDLKDWRSDFEEAKTKLPGEVAALEKERTAAARAIDDALAAVSRARAAIDERAASVPASQLATVLHSLGVPAGKRWHEARNAFDVAKVKLQKAEELVKERAKVEGAGVTPEEAGLGPAPDLSAERGRVEEARAALERADAEVREAFKKHPDERSHLALAAVTGDAADRARSEVLSRSVTALWDATAVAHEVAQRRVDDPNVLYPRLIAAAEAEVARLEAALASLAPTVKTIELGKRGDDTAQRELFGVGEHQTWEEWRKETIEFRRD